MPKATTKTKRMLLQWCITGLLFLLYTHACSPPANKVTVRITAPANDARFNIAQDEDSQTPGFQFTIRATIANAPSGSKASLTTNGRKNAEVELTSETVEFSKYTLDEGENSLKLTVSTPDGQVFTSPVVLVFVDSVCFDIRISEPKADALFGPRNDEDSEKDGFQKTIKVQVSPQPEAGQQVELKIEAPNTAPITLKSPVFSGVADFKQVTLPQGEIGLTAKITDSAGNDCVTALKVQVNTTTPQVTLVSPEAGKVLCPSDDLNPQSDGFQLRVSATTNADNKSSAKLFIDTGDNAGFTERAGPIAVVDGQINFDVNLSTLDALGEYTLQVRVTDAINNEGRSGTSKVNVRSRGYDLNITSVFDGQVITAQRDSDPQEPG
ncbi:MAG: hypothetical protein AAGJ35_10080, partial [Myxococcota bacterium]